MEVLPSRGRRSLTPKFQAMPKGHKFTNLDEAHQAITSGLAAAPRSASNSSHSPATPSLGSIESVPSSLDVLASSSRPSDLVPTVQHMELARADHRVNGRSLTSPHTPFSVAKDGGSYSGPSLAPPGATLPAFPVGLGSEKDTTNVSIGEPLSSRAPRETGSTVENIYKQYLPSETPSPASHVKNASNAETASSPKSPTASDLDEEGNDTNYRLESSENLQSPKIRMAAEVLDSGKNRHQMYFSPSSAPQIPLPELPKVKLDLQEALETTVDQADLSFTGPSVTSISDSQILLNGALKEPRDDGESIQYHADESGSNEPGPFSLHVQPVQELTSAGDITTHDGPPMDPALLSTDYPNRGSYMSQCGHSNGRLSSGRITSESDDDPFKYDRGSYDGFLRTKREREVSVALRRIDSTGSTPPAKAGPGDSPTLPAQSDIPPVPPLPAQPIADIPNGAATSNNPFFNQMSLRRYHRSVASQPWGNENNPNQVKISVQPSRNASVVKHPSINETPGLAARLEGLKGGNVTNGITINQGMTEGGDWETVGTEVGLFDSNRACASDSFFTSSRLIKVTGSSIADYSDDGFAPPAFSRDSFDSGERILQHPMDGPQTQHLRTLKDTGRPIFVPKPRIHQVNGYLQNSIRTLTGQDSLSTATSATRSLADKFTAPFRSDSFNRRRQKWRNRYNNVDGSRFEFRDSQGSANHSQNAGRATVWKDEAHPDEELWDEEAAVESVLSPEQSRYARTNEETPQSPIQDDSFMSGPDKSFLRNDGSMGRGSSVQFDFPLIPLREAARREALRRESGEDVSFVTTARTRGNSSLTSATHRTTPPTPPGHVITFPPPTHQRRPTTPFAIPETTESTLRTTGHPTISTGFGGSPLAPGRAVFPRSCRNPFNSVHGSDRTSSIFQSRYGRPHLFPRDRRNTFHRPGLSDEISLRGMIDLNRGSRYMFGGEDASLSWDARRRRECYYRFVCVLCVLPFFALLAYRETSTAALSWYTKGETCRLTAKQRRNVLRTAKISGMFWLCAIIVLVTVLITKSDQNKHSQE